MKAADARLGDQRGAAGRGLLSQARMGRIFAKCVSMSSSPWLPGAVRETVAHPVPLLTLGIFLTGFSFLIIWTAIRELSVAAVSVMLHIEPVSAVLLAIVFLDEVPDALQWIGIGMVIAGGLMAARDATTEDVLAAPANL